MMMFSWIADGSKQQFFVRTSTTSLRDILTQALSLRSIAPESGICFSLALEMFTFSLALTLLVGWQEGHPT